MRNAWFLQQEIIGCKPWRMGILRNCLLRPSSPYCRKKTMPKGRSSPSPDRCFFLWNTNSNLGRFKEPGLQETSSRCTAHRDSGEIVSFGPGGGSCAAQSNPTIVHWHVATEVWKLLAAITFFLCLRGGGSSFSKLIRLPKGSFVCQKKNNYNWWKTFLLIVLCSHVLHPLVGYGSKSPWIMRWDLIREIYGWWFQIHTNIMIRSSRNCSHTFISIIVCCKYKTCNVYIYDIYVLYNV